MCLGPEHLFSVCESFLHYLCSKTLWLKETATRGSYGWVYLFDSVKRIGVALRRLSLAKLSFVTCEVFERDICQVGGEMKREQSRRAHQGKDNRHVHTVIVF